jgi:hypothetical protein
MGQSLELAGWNQGHANSQLQSAQISARTKDGKELEAIPLQISGPLTVLAQQQMLFGFAIHPAQIPIFLNWPHPDIQSATFECSC